MSVRRVYFQAEVDQEKCRGCKECENICIAQAITVLDREGDNYIPPCQKGCPAGVNVQGYVALAEEGKIQEAYHLIRNENPFPSVCGRICTHPCETKCQRGDYDNPVAIVDIKRYIADYAFDNGLITHEMAWPKNGKSVGIIGAGPSGLSCAYYLALTGYSVEVYEAQPVAGGVLAFGIPQYRLPNEVLRREIDVIVKAGVQIHLSTEVGKDVTLDELRAKHQAVYVAAGAQLPRKVGVPGEDLDGIYGGLSFLRDFRLGKVTPMGKKLVVIGGGNTSIDVARTAVRLGCQDVTVVSLDGRNEMTADPQEVLEALDEGVKLYVQTQAVGFLGQKKVEGIKCVRTELKEISPGRRVPVIVEGTEFNIEADMVINAVNQYSELPFINKDDVELTKWGNLIVDEDMMTAIPGVFSGGDVIRGTDIAITAIADGKKAAECIHRYLGTNGVINKGKEIELPKLQDQPWDHNRRSKVELLPPSERKNNFDEVALGLTQRQITVESSRCFRCSGTSHVDPELCLGCKKCVQVCSFGAVKLVMRKEARIISIRTDDVDQEELNQMCARANLEPDELICHCVGTTAREIAAAVLKGAKTPTDVSRMTGFRSTCGVICASGALRLLNAAAGVNLPESDKYTWYNSKPDMWNTGEEVDRKYPQYRIKEDQDLFKQGIFHNTRRL